MWNSEVVEYLSSSLNSNMNLNYSINTLQSRYSPYNFFAAATMFLHTKITLSFKFERQELCLQALRMCVKSILARLARIMQLHGKNHPRETRFLICKSKISVVKNILPSRDGIIFKCNQKCIF